MKRLVIAAALLLILAGCNRSVTTTIDYGEAVGYAEDVMRNRGYVVAGSYRSNEFVKFRIMADNDVTKEEAKSMVEGFIKELESQIVPHLEAFYAAYSVQFDIKSNEDGTIL